MRQPIRRAICPMPVRVDGDALLRVSDQSGRIIRQEVLRAGTDLRERLLSAHQVYRQQEWAVSELRPGAWGFLADKECKRVLVAIREINATAQSAIPRAAYQSDPAPR